jgi:hypothetical protein
MIRSSWAIAVIALSFSLPICAQSLKVPSGLHEGNSDCWGDDSRQDITCKALTEEFLLSLRGARKRDVQIAMLTKGRETNLGLHYISNFSRGGNIGSGIVNFSFDRNDRTYIINASIDSPGQAGEFSFIWNAYASPPLGQKLDPATMDYTRSPYCSDLSSPENRCIGHGIEYELRRYQMSFGSTPAELGRVLRMSCSLATDTGGACARLSLILR